MIAWNCQYLFNNYWFKKWFSNVIEWRGKLMKNIGKTKKKNSVHCALSSRECTMVLYGV